MDFIDLASSFVISLIAGLGNSAIDRVVDNKSLEKRIKICFHKAVKQWDVSKDVKDSVKIKELEHFLELEKYLKNPAKGTHPKLGELLRLWIDELRNDQICYNFIIENKTDILNYGLNDAQKILKEEVLSSLNDLRESNQQLLARQDELLVGQQTIAHGMKKLLEQGIPIPTVNQEGEIALYVRQNNGSININIPKESDIEDIEKAFNLMSPLRHEFPSINPKIKRKEEDQIISWIEAAADKKEPKRVGFIVGAPGIGKTALTNVVYNSLKDHTNYVVWGFKVDLVKFDDVTDIENKMHLYISLAEAVRRCAATKKRVVVIVDQIDALSLSLSSDRSPLSSLTTLIKDISCIPNVRVLVSCREFDLEYDNTLNSVYSYSFGAEKWHINCFCADEVKQVLRHNGVPSEMSAQDLETLGNPQILEAFLKVKALNLPRGLEPASLDFNSLYDVLWNENIMKTKCNNTDCRRLLDCIDMIVNGMHTEQKISIPSTRIESLYSNEVSYLCTEGFLRKSGYQLQFTHQTWFDYAYARRFLETGKQIINELQGKHQGLFVRSQVTSVMNYMRTHDPAGYVSALKKILFNVDANGKPSVRFHLKSLALSGLFYQPNPTPSEIRLVEKILSSENSLGLVALKAVNTPEWADVVLSALQKSGEWSSSPKPYRDAFLGNLSAIQFNYSDYFFSTMSELLNVCNEDEIEAVMSQLYFRNIKSSPSNTHAFYNKLIARYPNKIYSSLFANIVMEYPDFVASEMVRAIRLIVANRKSRYSSHFGADHELKEVFKLLEQREPDVALSMCIETLNRISVDTAWKVQLSDVIKSELFYEYVRNQSPDMGYELPDFLFNHIVNTLKLRLNAGEDITSYLHHLIDSKTEPMVYAALCILSENPNQFKDLSYDVIINSGFINDSTPWVEYGICEVLRATFPVLDTVQQKAVVDTILKVKNPMDIKLCYEKNLRTRLEYGIPLTYEGLQRGTLLNAIDENILKDISLKGFHELGRLRRKFKRLENSRPCSMKTCCGWQSLDKSAIAHMSLNAWRTSMQTYNTDNHTDFETPTLTGQANAFRNEVTQNPDKFFKFILDIIGDDTIMMTYPIAGLHGLLDAERLELAEQVMTKIVKWIGDNLERTDRNFTVHELLFTYTDRIPAKVLPQVFFDFLCRVVFEKEDRNDSILNEGKIEFDAINRTRGHAAYNLVKCQQYPQYSSQIFDILEQIAPTANVTTRAAILLNFALLNNIDQNRSVKLFKILTTDYDPRLMAMPLHNLNPLLYYINYATDELIDYFEHAITTSGGRKTASIILWLAWYRHKHKRAKDILDRAVKNADAQVALITFFHQQNMYEAPAMDYILQFVNHEESLSELAKSFDALFRNLPSRNNATWKLAKRYTDSQMAPLQCDGYLAFLNKLAVINPEITLECINRFAAVAQSDTRTIAAVADIILKAYNSIRKYDDPDMLSQLELAMDILDKVIEQNHGSASINKFIHQLDND
ncbi:MAG: ATP-binding protein [Bacteroides sp.]|nr:ATP-binding protein [Bacteroides sp.]